MLFFTLTTLKSPEFCIFLQIFLCFFSLLSLFYFWGEKGILAYVILAVVAANIQVLKVADFFNGTAALAQGTIVFCSIFWAFDLLVEHFGTQSAKDVLWLSFLLPFVFTLWMLLTIILPPTQLKGNLLIQNAMETLFWPQPRLMIASLCAYFVAQGSDIWVFATLKKVFKRRFLGMRGLLSSLFGTCLDHIVFTILAFRFFTDTPLTWTILLKAYLLGGYGLRLSLTIFSPLALYAARILGSKMPNHHKATKKVL